jgi:hypothetical protein
MQIEATVTAVVVVINVVTVVVAVIVSVVVTVRVSPAATGVPFPAARRGSEGAGAGVAMEPGRLFPPSDGGARG